MAPNDDSRYLNSIPLAEQWAGFIWPGGVTSSEKVIALKDMEFTEDDVVIISYPKSGERTYLFFWLPENGF